MMGMNGSKLVSMKEAIKDTLGPGKSVVIEGFTHLICFAAAHEIIRQRISNLTLMRLTPDLVYDQIIEAGLVKKLIFSWAGNPGVGSLHALRRLVEKTSNPSIELEEYSHFGLLGRLLAASHGLPFWLLKNYAGTDIPEHNSAIERVQCPYTGQWLATVPAFYPDVAIIHCQRADSDGNAQVWGLMGSQKESAFAARAVIVVAEEIVDNAIIRQDPNRTLIPGFLVKHVVHEPFGCHPSYVQGYYDRDNDFYVRFEQISKDPKTYQDYLHEFVYTCENRHTYKTKMGQGLLAKLQAKSLICQGVNYGF